MKVGLLLIHGFLTGTDDWDVLLPDVAPLYDGVMLFSQPGHAREGEETNYKEFTADNCFKALARAVKEMEENYDAFDIVGHSMGGGMSLFAATSPKVRRAVLLAPALRYPRLGAFSRNAGAVGSLNNLAMRCADQKLASALKRSAETTKTAFKDAVAYFKRRLLPNWSVHTLLTFARIMGRSEKYVSKVNCPLTIIWGGLDEFIPQKSAKFILSRIGSDKKTFITYNNVGHAMMYMGDTTALARDLKCILSGGEVCEVETALGEQRSVTRYVREDDTMVITTVSAKVVREADGVKAIRERSYRRQKLSKRAVADKVTAKKTI